MSTKRYGKHSLPLLLQKTSFFENDGILSKKQKEIASIYKKQPKRTNCMNCAAKIDKSSDFIKDGIGYVICSHCQHLNGIYESTEDFFTGLYSADSGEDYAKTYYKADNIDDYNYRSASIYIPKAEFLYTSLLDNKINPHDLDYFDFGAGSGYFIAALKKLGLKNVAGTDVSKFQVNYGNAMLGEAILKTHDMKDTTKVLQACESEVVSMIGVLEHLQNPREVLKTIQRNKNVRFLYILVPTFSLSVYLEILSSEVFHRQLTGGHTHLYTKESLSYLWQEFGFEALSEWWFGTDMVDLFRHISVTLQKYNCSTKMVESWRQKFVPIIDAMQLELDKNLFSSEVHMVLKKND